MIYLTSIYFLILFTILVVSILQITHINKQLRKSKKYSKKYHVNAVQILSKEKYRIIIVVVHFLVYMIAININSMTQLLLFFFVFSALVGLYRYQLSKLLKSIYKDILKKFSKNYEAKIIKNTTAHKKIKELTDEDITLYLIMQKNKIAFTEKKQNIIKIYFTEKYFNTLSIEQIMVVMLHEMGHHKNQLFISTKWFKFLMIGFFAILLSVFLKMFEGNYLAYLMIFELTLFFCFRLIIAISHYTEYRADLYSKSFCGAYFFTKTLSKLYNTIKDKPESVIFHNLLYETHPLISRR